MRLLSAWLQISGEVAFLICKIFSPLVFIPDLIRPDIFITSKNIAQNSNHGAHRCRCPETGKDHGHGKSIDLQNLFSDAPPDCRSSTWWLSSSKKPMRKRKKLMLRYCVKFFWKKISSTCTTIFIFRRKRNSTLRRDVLFSSSVWKSWNFTNASKSKLSCRKRCKNSKKRIYCWNFIKIYFVLQSEFQFAESGPFEGP